MSEHDKILTPRTDKAIIQRYRQQFYALPTDPINPSRLLNVKLNPDFARALERELTTVTKDFEQAMSISKNIIEGFEQQRDSLRAKVEKLTNRNTALDVMLKGQRAEVERLKDILHDCDTAPAQSEPSQEADVHNEAWTTELSSPRNEPPQVDGKDNAQSFIDGQIAESALRAFSCITKLRSELAAAQATITELKTDCNSIGQQHEIALNALSKLRAENAALREQVICVQEMRDEAIQHMNKAEQELAALRVERDETQNQNGWITEKLLQSETQLATAIAERNAEHQFGSQMQAERDSVQSQLNAERVKLGTAIAERDEAKRYAGLTETDAQTTLATTEQKVALMPMKIATMTAQIKDLMAQRDSTLAACAAKDVALQHWVKGDDYAEMGRFVAASTHYAEAIKLTKSALSPAAGSDYVPKAPMVKLGSAASEFRNAKDHFDYSAANYRGAVHNQELVDLCNKATLRLAHAENALTAALRSAAPFLTDSTGEEGK